MSEPPTDGPPQKTTVRAALSGWEQASSEVAAASADPVQRPPLFPASPAASAAAASASSAAAAAAAAAAIPPGRGPDVVN